jgi:hypothetical protein
MVYLAMFAGAVFLLYKWLTNNNDRFGKQGIPHIKPSPIIGNLWPLVARKEGIFEFVDRYYNSFTKAKYEVQGFI